MKKRIISLLCAVLMLTAVCVPAFAVEYPTADEENTFSVMRAPEYAHVNAYGYVSASYVNINYIEG